MVILAIDTTTRGGSVAITRDDQPLSLVIGDESRTHGERVPGEIARALGEAGLPRSAIDLIAVAAGPGAFTGLRIGLATAQGLALTLDRPVVGVSALDALASTVFDGGERPQVPFVGAWMDAQRGDVFASLYRREEQGRWHVVEAPVTARPNVVLASWTAQLANQDALFVGDAALRDQALISDIGRNRWTVEAPAALAPAVARLGRSLAGDGHAGKPHTLTPIYVRRPDAEIERERRHGQ